MGYINITDSCFPHFCPRLLPGAYDILLIISRCPIFEKDATAPSTLISPDQCACFCVSLEASDCVKDLEDIYHCPWCWPTLGYPPPPPPHQLRLPFPVISATCALHAVVQLGRAGAVRCSLQPHLAACRKERMLFMPLHRSIPAEHQNSTTGAPFT